MKWYNRVLCRTVQAGFYAAMPVLPYRMPEHLEGTAALPQWLSAQHIDRVLLVTDQFIRSSGMTTQLEKCLAEAGIFCAIYDETCPNPTVSNTEGARDVYQQNQCQGIIAFGGGSVIDCAKAAGALVVYPNRHLNELKGLLRVWRRLPPLVAIPTTAGTGSETTVTAVITDDQTRHKYTMNNFTMIPRAAVLDPESVRTLPPHLTATTGMDALTHAVEAYIGRSTTRKTRAMAEEAVRLIFRYLERSYADGNDMEARKAMLKAAYLAGNAFSRSYVGYIHAVAHSLGGQYNIPHGLANAVLMPIVLDAYGNEIYNQLHRLAVVVGIAGPKDDPATAATTFVKAIRDMNQRMGIPRKLSGIRREDISRMAQHAHREANPLYPVPVEYNAAELSVFYEQVADWS